MTSFFSGLFGPFTGALGTGTAFIAILVGLISLFFGRRLYWLFVGIAGFLLGLVVGPLVFNTISPAWQPWLTLLIAVIFTVLSVVLNKFMIAIAGAIELGTLVYLLAQPNLQQWAVVILTVVGAIVGLLIAWFIFNWGLMIFSSLAGASLATSGVVSLFPGTATTDLIIFLFLFIVGLVIQIVQWSHEQARTEAVTGETEEKEEVVVVEDDDGDVKPKSDAD